MAPMVAEKRLAGGAHTQPFGQLLASAHGDPCALGSKALHMIFLFLQQGFGDQQRHGDVLVPQFLETAVQIILDVLPDRVAVGTQDKQALHTGIVHQLRLDAHVGEPLGKVLLHIGDLFYVFFFGHGHLLLITKAKDLLYSGYLWYSMREIRGCQGFGRKTP